MRTVVMWNVIWNTNVKHSEIYQGFKNRFGNKSGYIVSGVNWFLSGICNWVMYPQNVPEQENAGFFFDVFGRNSLVKHMATGIWRRRSLITPSNWRGSREWPSDWMFLFKEAGMP